MTTEETELTFVRCPSCRSLVPAVATRCRMCGYSFESGAESEELDEAASAQSKSRVRQRTISATREQIDELSAGAEQEAESDSVVSTPSLFPPTEVDDSTPLDPFGSGGFETVEEAATMQQAGEEAESEGVSVLESFSAAIMSSESKAEVPKNDAGISVDEPELFEEVAEETFVEPAQVEQSEVDAELEAQSEEEQEVEEAPKKKRRRRRKRKSGVKAREDEQVEQEEVKVREERTEMNGTPKRSKSRKPASGAAEAGVLVGWFVSFEDDPKGEAEELRSGKFFIGRQQLREDDMVIDKEGVSTPHCLVAIGTDGSLRIQDLMSEEGVKVQRLGEDSYETIDSEVVEIDHGDKLKLGSCELTVCLLPSE